MNPTQRRHEPFTKIWYTALRVVLILLTYLAIMLLPGNRMSVLAEEETTHIVQPGETLSAIARHYGISWTVLARYNGIPNANLIRAGRVLRIPSASSSRAADPPIILASPTPASVGAVPNGGSYAPIYMPDIILQQSTPHGRSNLRVHIVGSGESLAGIASKYRTTVASIKARNGLSGDIIYRGQRIIIPTPE